MPNKTTSSQKPESNTQYFEASTVMTLTGAVAGVVLVTNTISQVFDFNPQWLPLGLAMVLSGASYQLTVRKRKSKISSVPLLSRIVILMLNGFLIYSSAFGVQGAMLSEEYSTTPVDEAEEADGTIMKWQPLISFTERQVIPHPVDPSLSNRLPR